MHAPPSSSSTYGGVGWGGGGARAPFGDHGRSKHAQQARRAVDNGLGEGSSLLLERSLAVNSDHFPARARCRLHMSEQNVQALQGSASLNLKTVMSL